MRRRSEERREERRTFGRQGKAKRYLMRQKLVPFGDDFYIKDEAEQNVFKVDGTVLRVRDTYGVEIAPDQEDAMILAVTVGLDNMAHG